MLESGRSYSAGNQYRYGFNGKEHDPEVKGTGTQYDYGSRIYDPRLGRFLSVDPKFKAGESPYVAFNNSPIIIFDPDGADGIVTIKRNENGKGGTLTIKTTIHVSGENAQKQVDAANNYIAQNKSKFSRTVTEKISDNETANWDVNIEIVYVMAGTQTPVAGDNSMNIRNPDGGYSARTGPPSTKDEDFNKQNKKSLNGDVRYRTGNNTDITGLNSYAETNQSKVVLVHEPLHDLGLSDRYDPTSSELTVDEGFKGTNDIMQVDITDDNWSIGDVHFQNLLNFSLKESKRLASLEPKKNETIDPNNFVLKHQVDRDNKGNKIGDKPN